MTIKTSSGIKKFQEEKEFGPWFEKLYEVVCTMTHCQPEESIEPHVSKQVDFEQENEDDEDEQKAEESYETSDGPKMSTPKLKTMKKRKIFVPDMKSNSNNKKKLSMESTLETISNTLGTLSDAIKEDNLAKEFVEFLKDDAERQERRDNMLMNMMQSFMANSQPPPH